MNVGDRAEITAGHDPSMATVLKKYHLRIAISMNNSKGIKSEFIVGRIGVVNMII
jgi:hypothetical protein